MSKIQNIGKYLDQPILVGKFSKAMPAILCGGSLAYGVNEIHKSPNENKKKTALHTGIILASTVLSSLVAPKIASKAVGKKYEKIDLKQLYRQNTIDINNYLKENNHNTETNKILNKAKSEILNLKEITTLKNDLLKTTNGDKFFKQLIPEPENITSKDILQDMGRLSVMGAIPVGGGIIGGTIADRITESEDWKEKFPDKVKEGIYQYLANIFLCNVGAASALGLMESLKIKSKATRALGMVAGIVATGVMGGSYIANSISKKVVSPMLDKKFYHHKKVHKDERKPEILDVCLHTDDVATIAVMSGFKWIEPALPILYAVSGYRAAIGYRGKD